MTKAAAAPILSATQVNAIPLNAENKRAASYAIQGKEVVITLDKGLVFTTKIPPELKFESGTTGELIFKDNGFIETFTKVEPPKAASTGRVGSSHRTARSAFE